MSLKNCYKWLPLLFLGFAACTSDDDATTPVEPEVPITSGNADFSNYVSIGNSLTAGFTDGALFVAGQTNSFPNILSQQFAMAGGGEFNIPFTNDNLGGALLGGNQILNNRLFFDGAGPAVLPGNPTTEISNILTGPFNNMGVPGAKSFHIGLPGYGNIAGIQAGTANPYFVRMASSPNATILADALAQNPTFFTLWVGNNDVLSFATSGGIGVDQTGNPNPATYGPNDITDPTAFAGIFTGLVDALTANGAGGAVANIPDVNIIPFFTTVPHNPVPLDQATVTQLTTALLGPVGQILAGLGEGDRLVALEASESNPLLIVDESLTNYSAEISGALQLGGVSPQEAALIGNLFGQARHATENDFILLTTSTIIGGEQAGIPAPLNTIGVTYPLQDANVLTADEAAMIGTAVDAYNATIAAIAQQNGLAIVDANSLLQQVFTTGVPYENLVLRSDLVFGGAFGLDGVHPTSRGYAFIANEFMRSINATYGSNLPMVTLSDFPTLFPLALP
ncbi:G-D-S-L family lipolytic protein [Leptobacterium flavescens]|uniref:G-D-S-L family lipolytic protein n=1 Tax=Leptobacterium flavescens TaxID=472055 RepID=A0A6P0UUK3_9FLAO|nr:G-D-S-L family lipolytic protein [Leptobacterium flavescens]NER14493.1 G-D-S-L family lipolytic protein [Leptobacterium flavescens]